MSALRQILIKKSNNELMYYINHVDKHTEDAIWIALEILQHRNAELPKDIFETIKIELLKKREKQEQSRNVWSKNVTSDLDAPEFYSQKAIYIFSILFSVLFGSVMLAHNLYKIKKPFVWAILFGLMYSLIAIYFLEKYRGNLPGTFIANSLGAVVLYQLFWNKWIGKQTKYRTKPIWVPLIIAMIISIPLIIVVFYGL